MLLLILGSFAVALLSGLGVGGGGLFVVFLNLFTDMPQLTVQGINLLFFIFSSGSAVCVHLSRRRIFGTLAVTMAGFGIVGAAGGLILARFAGETLLRKIFGAMLVTTGLLTLQKKERHNSCDRG